jgi:hypothetical protein
MSPRGRSETSVVAMAVLVAPSFSVFMSALSALTGGANRPVGLHQESDHRRSARVHGSFVSSRYRSTTRPTFHPSDSGQHSCMATRSRPSAMKALAASRDGFASCAPNGAFQNPPLKPSRLYGPT